MVHAGARSAVAAASLFTLEAPGAADDGTGRAGVLNRARCASSGLDPDLWFPVRPHADHARREAAAAIAVCGLCPVGGDCLEFAVRDWRIGQYGVWKAWCRWSARLSAAAARSATARLLPPRGTRSACLYRLHSC